MEAYFKTVQAEAEAILADVPNRVNALVELKKANFSSTDPTAVMEKFTGALKGTETNVDLHNALVAVRSQMTQALTSMQAIERWIYLMIPKCEDGNNFGVDVQSHILKSITESKKTLQTAFDTLPDYYNSRVTALEKMQVKSTKETTTSTSSEKKNSDADETKTSSGTTEKTVQSQSHLEDLLKYVVAFDVKWYFNLFRMTETIQDQYTIALDILTKNDKKLRLPRGHKGDSGGMHMF